MEWANQILRISAQDDKGGYTPEAGSMTKVKVFGLYSCIHRNIHTTFLP